MIKVEENIAEYVYNVKDWRKHNKGKGAHGEVPYNEVLCYSVIFVGENCKEKLTDVNAFCLNVISMFDYCYEIIIKSKNKFNNILNCCLAMDILFEKFLGPAVNCHKSFTNYFVDRLK